MYSVSAYKNRFNVDQTWKQLQYESQVQCSHLKLKWTYCPASYGFVTVIFHWITFKFQTSWQLQDTPHMTPHAIDRKCTASMPTSSPSLSLLSLSAGDASKINVVHSINLMDKMSEMLQMWVHRASHWVNNVYSPGLCVYGPRSGDNGWGLSLVKHPVSRAELGQQRPLVGELERCCSLTHRKEKEKKRQEKKILAFNWGIIRDCLTYLSP